MRYNAYILDWTINNYELLKQKLRSAHFEFIYGGSNLRVNVPFDRVDEFSKVVGLHLNAKYNYVDIQFPEEKKTVLVFSKKLVAVSNQAENEAAKKWAVAKGLPVKQADWKTSY